MNIAQITETTSGPTEYGSYTWSSTDTFQFVANKYNTDIKMLAKLNNIKGTIPTYIRDCKAMQNRNYIIVPITGNGGKVETPYYYYYEPVYVTATPLDYAQQSSKLKGSYIQVSGGESPVMLTINGTVLHIPCYPKSISDSLTNNYSSESLFTSTEPYLVYSNSGPRTVNVSFQLHREMRGIDHDDYIDTIINTLQASCYPINDGSMAVEAILRVANEIYIRGVITGGIQFSYSPPIIDGKYNVIDFSFTIQEVYGENISYATKLSMGGKVKR